MLNNNIYNSNEYFFEELFNKYKNKLFYIANRMLNNNEESEDIIQETFIKVYKKINLFSTLDPDELINLLIVYTINTAKDHLRKQKREPKIVSLVYNKDSEEIQYEIPDKVHDPEEIIMRQYLTQYLKNYIYILTKEQRDVILLKYQYNYKEYEIATLLMISSTAVSSRTHRAKIKLRKLIESEN